MMLLKLAVTWASPYASTFTTLFFAAAFALPACALAIIRGNPLIVRINLRMVPPREAYGSGNHSVYYFLVAFFLPATVLRLPLRVRELVRVRCPRTGKPLR